MSETELELGDIIQIVAPDSQPYHNSVFLIDYIDTDAIVITRTRDGERYELIIENGVLLDKTIEEIHLLDRSPVKGYIAQNNIKTGNWIDIHFNGDLPAIITAQVTNVINDMLEFTTFPDMETAYIDFQYQGLPRNIPLEKIETREPPKQWNSGITTDEDAVVEVDTEDVNEEYTQVDRTIMDDLESLYNETNEIIFGKKLASVVEVVEVNEKEKRFDIEIQLNDLMEQLLSTVPPSKRTPMLENNIHVLIARFKELRSNFSVFQNDYIILKPKELGRFHKPLAKYLKELNNKLSWLIPVVKRRKKIYGGKDIEYIDVIEADFDEDNKKLNNAHNYNDKQRLDTDILRPFENPLDDPASLGIVAVNENIECIVNNLDDFKSMAIQYGKFISRRFAIETYLKHATSPDEAHIHSFAALPRSMFEYSRTRLPNSTILTRINEVSNYTGLFRMLHPRLEVNEVIVDDLDKDVDYTDLDLFNGVYNFSTNTQEREDKHERMADSIAPSTSDIIQMMRPYMKNKYSLSSCITEMEPFMVYISDITDEHYNALKHLVLDNINEYKKDYVNYLGEMTRSLRFRSRDAKQIVHNIKKLIDVQDQETIVGKTYGVTSQPSDSELLQFMNHMDNASLFYTILGKQHMRLHADSIEHFADNYDSNSKRRQFTRCDRRYLAKSYESLDALNEDAENKEIAYDEKYDETPYELLKKYEAEQKQMTPDNFIDFLSEVLVEKHETHPSYSKKLAKTIIRGKKIISDGDYAMVENMPRQSRYYAYKSGKWISDATVDEASFLSDNDLFCNILKAPCMKNQNTGMCESNTVAEERIRINAQNRDIREIIERMDNDTSLDAEQLSQALLKYARQVKKQRIINELRNERVNNIAYIHGLTAAAGGNIKSPNAGLFQSILSTSDFSMRQRNIVMFADKHTRTAVEGESGQWKYCIESGVPLVPVFLYDLAQTFIVNGDYGSVLAGYIRSNGVIDGDVIRDRYSGMEIAKLTFSTEEGYDQSGFIVSTRDIMDDDLIALKARQLERVTATFEDPLMEKIYSVFMFLAEMMDIPHSQIQDKVLKLAHEMAVSQIASEKIYLQKTGGKPTVEYEDYYNDMLIMFISASILVIIQTSVPSITKRKTFPGCVNSFTGYPYTGIEDVSGIEYISCVIVATRSSVQPWNSIQNLSKSAIVKRIKKSVDAILKRTDVSEMYKTKRMYEQISGTGSVTTTRSVSQWTSFRPPLVRYTASDVENITKEFHEMLIHAVKHGNKKQHQMYGVVNGKISVYTTEFIKTINNSVAHHEPLMKTYRGIPFSHNACCSGDESPLKYFGEKYPEVYQFIEVIKMNEAILEDGRKMIKAPMLYHQEDTSVPYPDLTSSVRENEIYAAFIHYCNFDKDLPIPQMFESLCDNKPKGYPKNATLEDKITFLKQSGKIFDAGSLSQLMLIVNTANKITIPVHEPHDTVQTLLDFLITAEDTDTIEEPIIRLMTASLRQGDNVDSNEIRTRKKQLKDYLMMTNGKMYDMIMDFIEQYGDLSNDEFDPISDFLFAFSTWTEQNEGIRHHNMSSFSVDAIRTAGIIAPNMILNSPVHSYNPRIRNGELAKSHLGDINRILREQYGNLTKFMNDTFLKQVAIEVSEKTERLVELAVTFPILNNNEMFFDIRTQELVLTYAFFSIFVEFINASENPTLRELNTEMRKRNIREMNKQSNEVMMEGADLASETVAEQTSALREVDIQMGESDMSKKSVSKLITALLHAEIANKQTSNHNYDSIKKRTGRSKDHEKKRIIKFLGDMSIENRKIEDMYKRYKMGRWNVGLQKGLVHYDKDTYERERNEFIQQMLTGDTVDGEDVVKTMVQDVLDIERHEQEIADQHDMEGIDISDLHEDYADGIVHPEDQ